ncbi:MAG: hypothetical protein RTU09_06790 [Candidatus Thorarchaeota archaeon]
MSNVDADIIRLSSVPLTREKQKKIEEEVRIYSSAVNYVIKEILSRQISSAPKGVEALREEFKERYDTRSQYLEDAVKTARVVIGQHFRMEKTIRSMRGKTPYFKPGRIIFSKPIVDVGEKALLLQSSESEEIAIPYDKHSRNRVALTLHKIAKDDRQYGRVRITYLREGYVEIDIRVDQ